MTTTNETQRFELHIDMDGAAFEDDGTDVELVRILRAVADRIEQVGTPRSFTNLHDVNGNSCGAYRVR